MVSRNQDFHDSIIIDSHFHSNALLSCGAHKCRSKCHQIQDHSKMPCTEYLSSICDAGHKQSWKCGDRRSKSCPTCEREAKLARAKQKRDLDAQQKRDEEQRVHLAHMDALDAQIAQEHRAREDARLAQERSQAIKQKENDLAAQRAQRTDAAPSVSTTQTSTWQQMWSPSKLLATASGILSRPTDERHVKMTPDNTPPISPSSPIKAGTSSQMPSNSTTIKPSGRPFPQLAESPSKKEWLRQKNMEGANNPSIDAIMDMTGLEGVKQKVLNIKAKIDLSIRQDASLKQERFNVVLLGNPGTGRYSSLVYDI